MNSFGNVRGWVFGAWGETSEEVHTLDQKLDELPPKTQPLTFPKLFTWDEKALLKKVRRADTLPGQSLISKSKAAQLASEVGFLRRRLSFASVQGHARLLLDPLLLLGDGAGEADGRRDRALAARRAEANEMRAQHTSMLIGRNIRRSGFGLLD